MENPGRHSDAVVEEVGGDEDMRRIRIPPFALTGVAFGSYGDSDNDGVVAWDDVIIEEEDYKVLRFFLGERLPVYDNLLAYTGAPAMDAHQTALALGKFFVDTCAVELEELYDHIVSRSTLRGILKDMERD